MVKYDPKTEPSLTIYFLPSAADPKIFLDCSNSLGVSFLLSKMFTFTLNMSISFTFNFIEAIIFSKKDELSSFS